MNALLNATTTLRCFRLVGFVMVVLFLTFDSANPVPASSKLASVDSFAKAKVLAKESGKPILLEFFAPW